MPEHYVTGTTEAWTAMPISTTLTDTTRPGAARDAALYARPLGLMTVDHTPDQGLDADGHQPVGVGKRRLIQAATAAGGLALAGGAFAVARLRGKAAYNEVVEATWRPLRPSRTRPAMPDELVRCATLAANSHNTQPWRFRASSDAIEVAPDLSRRLQAVDPDDHHLFISLGCAVENIVQAAPASGVRAVLRFDPATDTVHVALEPSPNPAGPLLGAIPLRQCIRADYDGRQVPPGDLRLLEAAGQGPGAGLLLFTDRGWIERFLPVLLAANAAQMADRAFIAELKSWIRFGYGDALATRDGLFTAASGNPVSPAVLGRTLFDLAFTVERENAKYARQLRSSAGVAVFVAGQADKAHWMEVGRCCQRFALQATALGLRYAFLNQPVEVPFLRDGFAALAGIPGQRPDLVVRFGYGPGLPRSLRRPVGQILA